MKMGENLTSPDLDMDEEECQIVHEKSTHIESSSPPRTCCFLCSTPIQDLTPIPCHVASKIAICIPLLKNIDPDSATNGEDRPCPVCLYQVIKVWNLHRKIVAIQAQIVTLLTRARQRYRADLIPAKKSRVVPPAKKSRVVPPARRCPLPGLINYRSPSSPSMAIKTESNSTTENGIDMVDTIFVGDWGVVDDTKTVGPESHVFTPRVETPVQKKDGVTHETARYPCSVCGEVFATPGNRIKHEAIRCNVVHPPDLLKKMDIRMYKCGVAGCGKVYVKQNAFVSHVETHEIDKHAEAYAGSAEGNLILNRDPDPNAVAWAIISNEIMLQNDTVGNNSCQDAREPNIFVGGPPILGGTSVCQDMKPTLRIVSNPVISKPPKRKYQYDMCKVVFSNQNNLNVHTRKVHGKEKRACSVCGKVLSSLQACVAHEAIVCKVSYSPEYLEAMSVYSCEVEGCGRLCYKKVDLERHVFRAHWTHK
ncbi:uncharacterized protein LOC110854580 isoform X1 [Folsomia candida]|uniref:uncharacterized protein LOC110854580 isoform X1 n=1 Tax=Folsomia candida TaxID=158441 RepID=UPI000B8FE672|nr:uncharacterized protein LOC110854580 isoform X1 [Folsomia candida]XP_035711141.1 uncharacterized protein LOC110854580 isoform X1 [Folsomia candida]